MWWATSASSEPQQTPIYSECSGNKPKLVFYRKKTARALSLSNKHVWIETTDKNFVLTGCFTVGGKNILTKNFYAEIQASPNRLLSRLYEAWHYKVTSLFGTEKTNMVSDVQLSQEYLAIRTWCLSWTYSPSSLIMSSLFLPLCWTYTNSSIFFPTGISLHCSYLIEYNYIQDG